MSEHDEFLKRYYTENLERVSWKGEIGASMVAKNLQFPSPTGIDINMMPFVMGDLSSIPEEYQHYSSIIAACDLEEGQLGQIGYLTITESEMHPSQPQRRGGIHTENPGYIRGLGQSDPKKILHWGYGQVGSCENTANGRTGGIYMASNLTNTCRLWNTQIYDPEWMGDCEHYRAALHDICGNGTLLNAGELWWMTDRTPHESLPTEQTGVRQFFRLVTKEVRVWFSKHSTTNPLGILPNSDVTEIIDVDKFLLTPEKNGM